MWLRKSTAKVRCVCEDHCQRIVYVVKPCPLNHTHSISKGIQTLESKTFAESLTNCINFVYADPKEKAPQKSYLWLHLLKEQADIREREWGEIRRYNLEGWEVVKRQWEQWKVQLRLRREAWRREHQKLLEVLLREESAGSYGRKSIVKYTRKHDTPAAGLEDQILTKPPVCQLKKMSALTLSSYT